MNISYVPVWFGGIDAIFEAISILVSLLISLYAYKIYRLASDRKYLFFSTSFLLIALSLLSKILTNIFFYTKNIENTSLAFLAITNRTIVSMATAEWFHSIGQFFFRALMITAFIILFAYFVKIKDKKVWLILLYFAFVTSFFSAKVLHIFYLTLAILSLYLVFYYADVYRENRKKTTLFVLFSFMLFFISTIFFNLNPFHQYLYVVAEVIQLSAFVMLLITFVMVLRR